MEKYVQKPSKSDLKQEPALYSETPEDLATVSYLCTFYCCRINTIE